MQEQDKDEQVGCPNQEEVRVSCSVRSFHQRLLFPVCLCRNDRQKYSNANKTVSKKAASQKK